jgi:hypothetical protein
MQKHPLWILLAVTTWLLCFACQSSQPVESSSNYQDLIAFFQEWRQFEQPPMVDGVPDYTAKTMAAQRKALPEYLARLAAFDTSGWTLAQRVDWEITRAEMKGLEFNHDVLRPWANNPTFYNVIQMDEADVPDREWPEIITVLNVFKHTFPLSDRSAEVFKTKLAGVPLSLIHI